MLLAGPVGWLLIAYLGSLAVLFVASLWQLDDFSGEIVHDVGFQNFQELIETPVYRDIVLRTVLIAALVTLADIVLAFPIAFYMAKVASPRVRALLVVAVLMPLWSSYLVKVYTWRIMLQNEGIVNWHAFELAGASPNHSATCACTFGSVMWFIHRYMQFGCSASELSIQVSDHPVDPSSGTVDPTFSPSAFRVRYWYGHVVPTTVSPLANAEISFV